MDFCSSATRVNLLRAFAGESQAAQRYQMNAAKAAKNQLYVVEQAFLFTANQEKEHAEIFWELLNGACGANLSMDANYPIGACETVLAALREAQHDEYQEANDVYPNFECVARREGFREIAEKFKRIAQIEQTHGDRFGRYADFLEAGNLFRADAPTPWMCLKCGHPLCGVEAPLVCPVCGHDQGFFIRQDLTPFRAC